MYRPKISLFGGIKEKAREPSVPESEPISIVPNYADNQMMKSNFEHLAKPSRTRHLSIHDPTVGPFRHCRRAPSTEETDFKNDVSQWNIEAIMENHFRECKEVEEEGGHKRRQSEWTFNRDNKDFLFPPNFSQKDREDFVRNRYCRRNAVCIYDQKGFSKFLSLYISTKHMMTFCI